MSTLTDELKGVKEASLVLQGITTENKNKALYAIYETLESHKKEIMEANEKDLTLASNLSEVMKKRLSLNEKKMDSICSSILDVIKLEDPVGKVLETINRPFNMTINKVSVPYGTIGVIFESRPNVCVDVACLCLKTGNTCVLKGGKEAIHTNTCLVRLMQEAIKPYVPENSIYLVTSTIRETTLELISKRGLIDLVVPRGGKGLISWVIENAKVPYIETGAGLCHIYIDKFCDLSMALAIAKNAKMSNPAVCNAVETILVHPDVASDFLPKLKETLTGVILYGDSKTKEIIDCLPVNEESYQTEYDDLCLNLKVCDLEEAIAHIGKYSTHHSESIVTSDLENAEHFMNSIDSACLYMNASTRFSDGGCFGFGAELGISTQKMHPRGPMGLKEMTTYKYKIYGSGNIREK